MSSDIKNRKAILTRILKIMGLFSTVFIIYILVSSVNVKPKTENSVFIKYVELEGVTMSIKLISGRPLAIVNTEKNAITSGQKWIILSATNSYSGCVIRLKNKMSWYDVCSQQKFYLNGKAQGSYADLPHLKYKKLHNGLQITL